MKNSKPVSVLVAAAVMLSQSGCIVGAATANPPVMFGGTILAMISGSLFGVANENGHASKTFNWITGSLFVAGAALAEKNPGRQEALNPLPVDEEVAKKVGANVDDLGTYNDELAAIHETNGYLESVIRNYRDGKLDEKGLATAAQAVGLTSSKELIDVLQKERLNQEDLVRFAEARHLSEKSAAIYLKLRFGVEVP